MIIDCFLFDHELCIYKEEMFRITRSVSKEDISIFSSFCCCEKQLTKLRREGSSFFAIFKPLVLLVENSFEHFPHCIYIYILFSN